ncbi:MAG: leucyl/phenylalanyl-tRNA--protein transferase [Deltaproteobacteria bacterium]|nr:MAG: leucyl/phenylalanyl-tRNA--protein transferase [Deltaproteobacteria bacterium]
MDDRDRPIYRLSNALAFPDPLEGRRDGLLAVGGDLKPERLLLGYQLGIFPWYTEDEPILWWSPDPRMVLFPEQLHIPRSLKKSIRKGRYRITADTVFSQVITACAHTPRPFQDGTWLVTDMIAAYHRLHQLGFAHSFEAWNAEGQLVGGLYGVSIGRCFFGESMFSLQPDASKTAFVKAVAWLEKQEIELIDCQVTTDHLERFGGVEISRQDFLEHLAAAVNHPTRRGRWVMEG